VNPYESPAIESMPTSQVGNLPIRNPARFLLYPLAVLCVGFSLLTALHYVQNGFDYKKMAVYMNAGVGLLIAGFGTSAFLLAARQLTKITKTCTIIWSLAALGILLISLYFEPTASIRDVSIFLFGTVTLILIAIVAFRRKIEDPQLGPF
jgi:predicted membrane channel-forming protein YqfA (hemolysin III family)